MKNFAIRHDGSDIGDFNNFDGGDVEAFSSGASSNSLGAGTNASINGTPFDDTLFGTAGDDFLQGLDGNDVLIGGANGPNTGLSGGDWLFGGNGIDTSSYETSSTGVLVSLLTNANNTGDASGDLFFSIENLRGSNFNDTLIGDAGSNVLEGRDGADILIGGAGGDLLSGGAGNDTASYAGATAGVVANLASSSFNTGDAAGDTYSSIENLRGSSLADTLFGNTDDNVLEGGAGADNLFGGGGNDTASYQHASAAVFANLTNSSFNTGDAAGDVYNNVQNLTGSSFADTLFGNTDDNVLEGGAGADNLFGGGGNDTASYEHASAAVFANLTNSSFNIGDAAGDVCNNVQNLRGSSFADTLVGNTDDNVLEGGAGADALIGGGGHDTASYANSNGTVFVFLDGSNPGSGDAAGDTYNNIDNVRGTRIADFIVGNDHDNDIEGGGGADSMYGGAGFDTASYTHAAAGVTADLANTSLNTGEAQADFYDSIEGLKGSAFADNLIGNSGNNAFDGGAGNDTLTGGTGNDTFVFRAGLGHDNVTDFVAGQDVIELHDGLFANANAAFAAATQSGADVVITVDAGDSIVLQNVALANLHASDFHVV